jgi:hypothetical protein
MASLWLGGTGAAAASGLVTIIAFISIARLDKPVLDRVRRCRQKTTRRPPEQGVF